MRREADGRLDLVKFFFRTARQSSRNRRRPLPPAKKNKPWTAQLGSLQLIAAALRFEDRTLPNGGADGRQSSGFNPVRYRLERCNTAEAGI